MLPKPLTEPIEQQLQKVRGVHQTDLVAGFGDVWLPYALSRKYPNAGREWAWQYAFPEIHRSRDPETERRVVITSTNRPSRKP